MEVEAWVAVAVATAEVAMASGNLEADSEEVAAAAEVVMAALADVAEAAWVVVLMGAAASAVVGTALGVLEAILEALEAEALAVGQLAGRW